jgi:glycosyltransferase involved in cell wall biosynthesis
MNNLPLVSVVLPVRNEEQHITETMNALSQQDYPISQIEVIVADGMSDDNTRKLLNNFCERCNGLKIKVIDNPERSVSFGLNIAIKASAGEVIVRMDSHSIYPINYISRLVSTLYEFGAHNVGGVVNTIPATSSNKCKAIAAALSHPIGVGNSHFRIGATQIREVDTVPFGCFRREVFERVGFFDEELIRNQDDEFNGRILNAGMQILLIPDVVVNYYARDSFLKLFKMYYQYGLYKPLASFKLGGVATVRQLIPLFFVLYIVGGALLSIVFSLLWLPYSFVLMLYFVVLFMMALRESLKKKSMILFQLILSFFILHFSYGIGYLKGLIAIITKRKGVFKNVELSR